jgi:hypothetical protein
VNRQYWEKRIAEYQEMVEHIKNQRAMAEGDERRKLALELEQLFNEINVIKDFLKHAA